MCHAGSSGPISIVGHFARKTGEFVICRDLPVGKWIYVGGQFGEPGAAGSRWKFSGGTASCCVLYLFARSFLLWLKARVFMTDQSLEVWTMLKLLCFFGGCCV